MNESINPGSVVRLRSGGPDMVVSELRGTKLAVCNWIYQDRLCETTVPVGCLELLGNSDQQTSAGDEPTAADDYQAEKAWLRQLRVSQVVGYCFIDAEGRLMQRFTADPRFRALITDWQFDQLTRVGEQPYHTVADTKPYPVTA